MDGLVMCLVIVDGGSGLRVTGGVKEFGDKLREFSRAFQGGGGKSLSKECTKRKEVWRVESHKLRAAHHLVCAPRTTLGFS